MAPFIELLIFLAFCILACGAWGILVFIGVVGGYFAMLYLIGKSGQTKKPPG